MQLLPVLVDQTLAHHAVDRLTDHRNRRLLLQNVQLILQSEDGFLTLLLVLDFADVSVLYALLPVLQFSQLHLQSQQLLHDHLVVLHLLYLSCPPRNTTVQQWLDRVVKHGVDPIDALHNRQNCICRKRRVQLLSSTL